MKQNRRRPALEAGDAVPGEGRALFSYFSPHKPQGVGLEVKRPVCRESAPEVEYQPPPIQIKLKKEVSMDDHDKKVRKQWLAILLLSMLFGFITIVLAMLGDKSPDIPILARNIGFATYLLCSGVITFVHYRCSYKKPGTKLLTFTLIMALISFPITLIFYLCNKMQTPDNLPSYYGIVSHMFGILWIIACWRVRKTNKRLQTQG